MGRFLPATFPFEAEVADPDVFFFVDRDPEADAAGAAAFVGRAGVRAPGRGVAEELAAEAGRLLRLAAVFVVVADPDAAPGVDREVARTVQPPRAAFEAQGEGPGGDLPAPGRRRRVARRQFGRQAGEPEQAFDVVPRVGRDVDRGLQGVRRRSAPRRAAEPQQARAGAVLAAAERQQAGQRVEGAQGRGRPAVGEVRQHRRHEAAAARDQVAGHRRRVAQPRVLAGDAVALDELRHRITHRDGGALVERHPVRHTPGAEHERQLVAVGGHREAGFCGAAGPRREQVLDRCAAGAAVAEHEAPAATAARVAEHDRAPFAGVRRQHRHRHSALRDVAAQDRDAGWRAGSRGGAGREQGERGEQREDGGGRAASGQVLLRVELAGRQAIDLLTAW